ncbi:MAG: PadR family transcriptional regulator [Acidimicrobiales bacterium]
MRGRGRGGRARRGDVRAAVLLLLSEAPRNGYQIIQELAERSRGTWRPSPGSVYPVLQQLEDEGLVVTASADVGRLYRLTEAGTAYVSSHRAEMGVPWEEAANAVGQPMIDYAQLMHQVVGAMKQVIHAGNEQQLAQAAAVLTDTRRALYRILAEDAPAPESVRSDAKVATDEGSDAQSDEGADT